MSKIKELTPEQQKDLEVCRQQYFELGKSTEHIELNDEIREIVAEVYKEIDSPPPQKCILMPSPMGAVLIYHFLDWLESHRGEFGSAEEYQETVNDPIWQGVAQGLRDITGDPNVVDKKVISQMAACRRDILNGTDTPSAFPFIWGNIEIYWVGFYSFGERIGVKYNEKDTRQLALMRRVCDKCGCLYLFEKIAIVCDRPEALHFDRPFGVVHHDSEMAIRFRDGYGLWKLNGLTVPKKYVITPREEMDPMWVVQEENAQIRAELIKKMGVEMVYEKLGGRVLDKEGDMYELITIDLQDGRRRPYLKMLNPSIGIWHMEGVPPDTKTVAEALAFRNGTTKRPLHLT